MVGNLVYKVSDSIGGWFRFHFLTKKMTTPVGIAVLGLIALLVAYVTATKDYVFSIWIVVGVGIVLILLLCILYPFFGFYFTFFISMFIVLPERVLNSNMMLPFGLVPEYISYLVLLGVVTKQQYRNEVDNKFWGNMITIWLLVLLSYYFIQLFNPYMNSKLGWFNFFRKQVSYAAFFYMSYCFFNSRKAILFFTKFWIILSTAEALYACKQQWFGLFKFEHVWLMSDTGRIDLFINWGFLRVFGLLSDPAAAGILYSMSAVFLLILGLRTIKRGRQILYFTLALINFLASSYTGTRTGTLMLVAGVAFYCLLTLYEKKTIIFSVIFGLLLAGIMVVPIYDNFAINRIRSTFEGSKDPSAKARDFNRKTIQPYVYRHPIGGGVNTSGLAGTKYNPGHYLSTIPPDSAYMQMMMEQGWIGLIFMLMFYYAILRTGIKNFYRSRHFQIKGLYVAYLVTIFTLIVAQFSQLAIGQYPSVLFFYSALAILIKLHAYDTRITETL